MDFDDDYLPDRYEIKFFIHGTSKWLSYVSLANILIGLVSNTAAFLIFRLNKNLKHISSFVYLSFIVVLDTLALFVWNLNNFTGPNFNIQVEYLSLLACRVLVYVQYFSLQSSAALLSVATFDRYVTVISVPGSIYHKLPFSTAKSAFRWSLGIIVFFLVFNLHILVFNGYYDEQVMSVNRTMQQLINDTYVNVSKLYTHESDDFHCYSYSADIFLIEFWNRVHLIVYSFVPFSIMLVFNLLLIKQMCFYRRFNHRRHSILSTMSFRNNGTSISMIVITFLFILLTAPNYILWGFFYEQLKDSEEGSTLLIVTDTVSFVWNYSIFFTCFMTYPQFRKVVMRALKRMCCYSYRLEDLRALDESSFFI